MLQRMNCRCVVLCLNESLVNVRGTVQLYPEHLLHSHLLVIYNILNNYPKYLLH